MIDGTTPNRKEGARMQLGTFRIENPIVLAPMAGVTDWAYRCIAASLGADITVTEMVSSRALVYKDKKSISLLRKTDAGICGAQIFGNDPSVMAEGAALALEHSGADFIDINMGCPMPKIAGNGDGSALMKDPEKAARIVEAVKTPSRFQSRSRCARAGTRGASMRSSSPSC